MEEEAKVRFPLSVLRSYVVLDRLRMRCLEFIIFGLKNNCVNVHSLLFVDEFKIHYVLVIEMFLLQSIHHCFT